MRCEDVGGSCRDSPGRLAYIYNCSREATVFADAVFRTRHIEYIARCDVHAGKWPAESGPTIIRLIDKETYLFGIVMES